MDWCVVSMITSENCRRKRSSIFFVLNLLFLLTVCTVEPVAGKEFSIVTDTTGSYTVQVNGKAWLNSGPTFFRANSRIYSTSDGSLRLVSSTKSIHGTDIFGPWSGSTFNYSAGGSYVETNIRVYETISAAVFTQVFVSGFGQTSAGDAYKVVSGFPSIQVGNGSAPLGYLAFNGLFIGWQYMETGRLDRISKRLHDGLDSGPLVIFDEDGRTLVISPLDRFMAASYWHNTVDRTISWGVMGHVGSIPREYTYSTVIFYESHGINKAVEGWGELLRLKYDRKSSSRDLDPSINYIGYYTDNGAYYYQVPEVGKNFEYTLLGVFNYSSKSHIPYRYLQYDDWFYPTAGPTSYGATVIWDAMPSVFPHGLRYLYNATQLPVVAHNRYWSDKTPYARQNGGLYNFVFDGKGNALPDDQSFWDYLFATAKPWGLLTYEQDWLNYQIENFTPAQDSLELGTRWLRQMGDSAERTGLFLQYCMALPRNLLASLEIPSVSQARASIDYMLSPDQYKIGISSLFAHSLGIAPFKDNFWTKEEQPGNRYHKKELNPRLQAIISLLSTGPVGVSDRIGYSDLDLIMRLTTDDGLLLKPSRPATAIDNQIIQGAFGGNIGPKGEVWTTFSDISGFTFGVVLAMSLSEPYTLKFEEGNWGSKLKPGIVYSSDYFMPSARGPAYFNPDSPLPLSSCYNYTDLCFYYVSPILHIGQMNLYIRGEMAKALPVSPKRIRSIDVSDLDLSIELSGTPSERVDFEICRLSDGAIKCTVYSCVISHVGKARLSLLRGPNECR